MKRIKDDIGFVLYVCIYQCILNCFPLENTVFPQQKGRKNQWMFSILFSFHWKFFWKVFSPFPICKITSTTFLQGRQAHFDLGGLWFVQKTNPKNVVRPHLQDFIKIKRNCHLICKVLDNFRKTQCALRWRLFFKACLERIGQFKTRWKSTNLIIYICMYMNKKSPTDVQNFRQFLLCKD